jgi:hypothetical protein
VKESVIASKSFRVWRIGVSQSVLRYAHSHELSVVRYGYASGSDIDVNTHFVQMECAIALIDIFYYEKGDIGPQLVSRNESL